MDIFFSSMLNKNPQQYHQCPKTHICTNKACLHSYIFICQHQIHRKNIQQQYQNHLKYLLSAQQFLIKLEHYKESNKFQAKLVAFSATQIISKIAQLNHLKTVISEKQNQILSHLAKIQQLFTKSISFQKILAQNIFHSQNSILVLQNIKQNLQYNLHTKSFVDTFTAQINHQLIEHKSFVHLIQQETNISKNILQDIRKITKKMHNILSQKETQQERQLSFSIQYQELEPWESQQKSQSKIYDYLQRYIKAFKKQFEIRFQTFNKIKQTVSNHMNSNSLISEDISLRIENPSPSLLKKKIKILNVLSIDRQKQKQFPSQKNSTTTYFDSKQGFQSPKISKLQLVSQGKQFQEKFIKLQIQRNQFEEQLLKLKNDYYFLKIKLENQNKKNLKQKYEYLFKEVKELKQQLKRLKENNQGIKEQINQQICNYIEQFYQDQKFKNKIVPLPIVSLENQILQRQQNLSIENSLIHKMSTASQQLLQGKIKSMPHQKSISFPQINLKQIKPEIKEQDKQSIQNILYQARKKQKQNQNLVSRLKQLQLIIQDKNKQILKLQKLKFQNTISQQYDDQLKINKSYYENQVFLAKEENQKLQTKIKYLRNKIQNINTFNVQQNQRIFEAESKGSYLQSQLNQTIWQKYILNDKNIALEKKIKHLQRTIQKFKDQFYVLKDYTSKLEKSKYSSTMQNSYVPEQDDSKIDLDHFDIQQSICQSPLRNPHHLKVNQKTDQISPGLNFLQKIVEKNHQLEQSKKMDNLLNVEAVPITGSQILAQFNQQQQILQKISGPPLLKKDSKESNDLSVESLKLFSHIQKNFEKNSTFRLQKLQKKSNSRQKKCQNPSLDRAKSQKSLKSKNSSKYQININEPIKKDININRIQPFDSFSLQFKQQNTQNQNKQLMFINQILRKQRKGDNLVSIYKRQ